MTGRSISWTAPSCVPISTRLRQKGDPAAEALGRSRGGYSTKIHLRCERSGKPMVPVLTGGERHEQPVPPLLMEEVQSSDLGVDDHATDQIKWLATRATAAPRSGGTSRSAGSRQSSRPRSMKSQIRPLTEMLTESATSWSGSLTASSNGGYCHTLREAGGRLPRDADPRRYPALVIGPRADQSVARTSGAAVSARARLKRLVCRPLASPHPPPSRPSNRARSG